MELKDLIEKKTSTSFVEGYKATDQEGLGMLISQYFGWDGLRILETLYYALEDANFHKENEIVQEMINKLKGGA